MPVVVAECVFVLESFYEHPRSSIAEALRLLLLGPGVECQERGVCLDALERYAHSGLHFVDCLVVAQAAKQAIPIATFDKGIKKLKDVAANVDIDERLI